MSKKPWKILFVTTSATSLIFLDNTIMPVALATIEKEFKMATTELMWIVDAYLLTLTALMMICGRLYDLIGMRKMYYWGLSFFGLGSLVGGISIAHWMLIVGRIVQGIGGAFIVPATGAILIASFDSKNRAKALGINTGISSVFLILGPVVGGVLTEYLNWRYIFFVNLPVLFFGFMMAHRLLPHTERAKEPFHFLGAVPLALFAVGLVVPLMEGETWGWLSPWTLGFFASAIFFFLLFIWASKHTSHPIIDFSIFRRPYFLGTTTGIFVTQFLLMATVLWAIYFQNNLHYTPAETGLIIMIVTLPVAALAPLGGHLTDRYGAKGPMTIGFLLLCGAMLWFGLVPEDTDVPRLLPGLLAFGCGIPMILSPAFATAMSHMPANKLGAASSFTTTSRQLGSTIGVAVMSAIFYAVEIRHSPYIAFKVTSLTSAFFAIVGLILIRYTLRKQQLPLQ